MNNTKTSIEIATDLLNRTGLALDTGDFENFAKCFAPPVIIETLEAKQLLQTERDVRRVFDAVRDFRSTNSVAYLKRENIAAKFLDENTICTTHISHMYCADHIELGRPFAAYSEVRLLDGAWRITFCQYALEDKPQLGRAFIE